MPPVCPRCGTVESSQAVSAIVNVQTSRSVGTTNSIGASYYRGSVIPSVGRGWTTTNSSTSLATMLGLPSSRPGVAGLVWGIILMVFALVIAVAFYAAAISSEPDPKSPIPHDDLSLIVAAIMSAPFWIPGVGILLVAFTRRYRYRRAAPLRQHMAGLWQQAMYCHRDGVAYLPHGPWSPPEAFRPMLRAEAIQALNS